MFTLATSDGLSDESLLAGLGAGDRRAATAFVRRFERRVYGLALTVVGDPALAEDVAQEALTRAWRHAQAYDPRRGAVATWLLAITRNLAIDAIRMRRSDPRSPGDLADLLGAGDGSEGGPAEAAVASDEGTAVRAALQALPAEQRRALVLSAFHGRTAREIAELERIPLGTAKTRIRAGLMRLRGAMAAEVTI
ncbi:MAG TPA: sigma-70 family RNA polymerase sigma factor [Acidimicrobiales bacterium]|nr:sigma-70 family RNA polymerase sigma factor [Acidimicrobiales bacterium]